MEMTFSELCRMAQTAEVRSHAPLSLEEQSTIRALKLYAWHSVNTMIEQGLDLLDMLSGDPDLEDATGAEDAFEDHEERTGCEGPGCPVADAGGGNVEDEGEAVDEREPDHDVEVETWSHWMDHPADLHIGRRPGWNC